jgi:hypothetical protein
MLGFFVVRADDGDVMNAVEGHGKGDKLGMNNEI